MWRIISSIRIPDVAGTQKLSWTVFELQEILWAVSPRPAPSGGGEGESEEGRKAELGTEWLRGKGRKLIRVTDVESEEERGGKYYMKKEKGKYYMKCI